MQDMEKYYGLKSKLYKNIVLYGTGYGAEYIFPYFETRQMLSQIYAVVDRDDSPMIGMDFHGYKVKKLSDVLEQADVIMNVSKDYWQIISERVRRLLEKKNIYIPVIEVFNEEALYKSREINVTYVDNKIKEILKENLIPHFYILCVESMGDVIACEPIARTLKLNVPNSRVTWIVKQIYLEIVKYNPFVDEVLEVSCLSEASDFCNSLKQANSVVINCHFNRRACAKTKRVHWNDINPMINENTYYNYGSLLESFSLIAGMKKISDEPYFYESGKSENPIERGKRYIVVHCKSSESCRDWQCNKWNELVHRVVSEGYYVVEIGLEPIITSESERYIDCTYIHDIQIIAQVIKGADIFVSGDSGFAHIANCYRKEAVLLMGKYRDFNAPMPYTGYYALEKESNIMYANGSSVHSLEVDQVYTQVIKKLPHYL